MFYFPVAANTHTQCAKQVRSLELYIVVSDLNKSVDTTKSAFTPFQPLPCMGHMSADAPIK